MLANSTKYCGYDDPDPESESNESDFSDIEIEIKESPIKKSGLPKKPNVLADKSILDVIMSYLVSHASETKSYPTINIFKLHMLSKQIQITIKAVFFESSYFGTFHDFDCYYEMMMNPKRHLYKYQTEFSKDTNNKQSVEAMINCIESAPRIFSADNYLWNEVKQLKQNH